jgi:hypothetical protein
MTNSWPQAYLCSHSQAMWSAADVIGLFSRNVVSFSRNVVPPSDILSQSGPKTTDVIGRPPDVIGPLQLGETLHRLTRGPAFCYARCRPRD